MTGRPRKPASPRRTTADAATRPASPRHEPSSSAARAKDEWVVGPYGDLISREDYEAMMGGRDTEG